MSTITIEIDDADVQPDETVGDVHLTDELHEAVARRLEEGLGIDIGEVDVRIEPEQNLPSPTPRLGVRHPDEIAAKIEELQAFDDYGRDHAADYRRRKHGGWIEALRWALGHDPGERPL